MKNTQKIGYSNTQGYYNAYVTGYVEGYNAVIRLLKSDNGYVLARPDMDYCNLLVKNIVNSAKIGESNLFAEVFAHGYYDGFYDNQEKCLEGIDVTLEDVEETLNDATYSYSKVYTLKK